MGWRGFCRKAFGLFAGEAAAGEASKTELCFSRGDFIIQYSGLLEDSATAGESLYAYALPSKGEGKKWVLNAEKVWHLCFVFVLILYE